MIRIINAYKGYCQKTMSSFQDIKKFQRLYGEHFTKIQTIYGRDFYIWFKIIRRVLLKVAKKLSRPYSQRVQKCFASCFNQMTIFDSELVVIQMCLKPESFVIPLQRVDTRLPILLFQIISDVINHPHFSSFCVGGRRHFQEGGKILCDRSFYYTLRVLDAFSKIAESFPVWVSLIPVPRPIFSGKFLRSRLKQFKLCVFGDLGRHLSSMPLQRRGKLLCISGIFRVLFKKVFLNCPIRQMKWILRENFSVLL
jgi:hypothetical protein